MMPIPTRNLLVLSFVCAAAASAAQHEVSTSGLRANAKADANQDARRSNAVTSDRYWVAPIKNSGLTCIDKSIRAGGGKPLEVCLTEGEALCIEYSYKPMGGRWQFGIKDSKLRLYDPRGEIAYEYCRDVTHLCIGEEHGINPNRYSKERPYLTLYDEKTHEVVGSLTCDGTDGKDDENLGQSTILKLVDQADVGPYANYPLTLVKFKKGQTEDPNDDNSLWNITVTEPVAMATGLQLESFLNYNADRCEWNSYVDSFEELKRQIAAATDSDPGNRAKIEVCEDMPILFDSVVDLSNKYFELSCLGAGCVFDLNGYSFVTPDEIPGSAFNAKFEGVTIENGSAANGRNGITELQGGAFLLRGISADESKIDFKDCVFRNNDARFGGAISSSYTSFGLYGCRFEQNTAILGGAIYSFGDAERYLRDCDFEGNSALIAGAMYASDGAFNVRGSTFKHNTAARSSGGALYISRLQYDFQSSQFIGNFAEDDDGGAIYGGRGINGNISDCLFEDNIAAFSGGAIYGLSATVVLDSNFMNNTALSCGAMCASVTTLRGCRFEDNSAKRGNGGAIRGDFKNVQECHFKGNKAEFNGGAIATSVGSLEDIVFESNEAGVGGGAILMVDTRRLESTTMKGCLFLGNRAFDGGAIEFYDISTTSMEDVEFKNNMASGVGGAINFFSSALDCCSSMQLNDCRFEGNAAEFGGAIFSYNHPRTFIIFNPSQIHLKGCYFGGNTATNFGGAIGTYNTETSIIGQSTFVCNSAEAGGAIHHENDNPRNYLLSFVGELAPIAIDDAQFIHNTADLLGGALLVESAPSSVDRCTFDQNEASISGGAIVISDIENTSPANSTHNLTRNTFQNNKSQGTSSDDILFTDTDGGSTFNCGNGYDNCFCDANPADLPDISTISPADTCPDAGIAGTPPSCTCIPSSPTTCPLQSRAGAIARAGQNGPHDTEELLKTLHEKQELMFEEMLLRLNSTNSSSLADDDGQNSRKEKLEVILEKYGIQIQP